MGICFGKCCGATVSGNVKGCNSIVQQNISVSITSGTTAYGPTTTDASGNWSIPSVPLGAATITYTPPATNYQNRYATGTQSITVVSGTNSENFTLSPASGYKCCTGFNIPVATTLHFTDTNGTHATNVGGCPWSACYIGNPGHQVWKVVSSVCTNTTINVAFTYTISLSVSGGVTTATVTFTLYSGNIDFSNGCSAPTNLSYSDCSGTVDCHTGCAADASASGSATCNPNAPPSFSVTLPANIVENITGKTYTNPVAGTVTVSE